MSHIIEWTSLWRACPDHEMECRLVEKIQREATKAALEKADVDGLRNAAKLAMEWNPVQAGLPGNFLTWQHAMGLFVEHLQRLANARAALAIANGEGE